MTPKKKWRWLVVLLSLLFLSGLALIVTLFLNRDYLQHLAVEEMYQTFGSAVTIGQTDLSFFPRPQVDFTDVVVRERSEAMPTFQAKHIRMVLGMDQLLRQKLVIKELFFDQPDLVIIRKKSGQWRLFSTLKKSSDHTVWGSLLLFHRVLVTGGRMTVMEESASGKMDRFVIQHLQASLANGGSNGKGRALILSGEFQRFGGNAQISMKGWLRRSTSDAGIPQIDTFPSWPSFSFAGQLDGENVDLSKLAGVFHVHLNPVDEEMQATLHSYVRFDPGQVGYDLGLSDMTVETPFAAFEADMNLSGLFTHDRTVSLSFRSTPMDLVTVKRMIPVSWLPAPVQRFWPQTKVGGTINVVQATITGSSRPEVGMSMAGEFHLDNSSFTIRDVWPVTEQVQGNIIVEPDRMRFVDFKGRYDALPVTSARGMVLFKQSGPWLDVVVQGEVPGKRIIEVLGRLVGTKESLGIFSTWDVTEGSGLLKLHFGGGLGVASNHAHGIRLKEGEYIAKGLLIHVPVMRTIIANGLGRFKFSPLETELDHVSGWVGKSRFLINGTVNTQDAPVFRRLHVQATVEKEELERPWFADWSPGHLVRGPVDLDLMLTGPVSTPKIKGDVNLSHSRLSLPQLLQKQGGVPASLEFEARIQQQGPIIMDRAELLILPFRLTWNGVIRLRPSFQLNGHFTTGKVYVGLLPKGLRLGSQALQSGIVDISLDVVGTGVDWKQWDMNGWVALTEGVVTAKGLGAPVNKIFLRLKVGRRTIEMKRFDFQMKDSEAHFTGTINHWQSHPDIQIKLDSPQFDIDLLIPKDERSPIRAVLESLAANGNLTGSVSIDRPWYQDIALNHLKAQLRIHDGLVTVDHIRGSTEGGPLAGRLFIHLPLGKPAAVRASFMVKGLPFEALQRSLGVQSSLVTGTMTARGKIQGHGRDSSGVVPTLQGKIQVQIEHGHVHRGTILPRILALLNLPTVLQGKVDLDVQGFPFDSASTLLVLEKGIVTPESFVLDSPIMKMTAAGHYDLGADQLHFVAAVSPFGRYSAFLEKIPLFGKIFAGDRSGVATALFKIRGPLEDPKVTYMPLRSLTKGLKGLAQLAFDILKNTVMLPVELIPSTSEEKTSGSSGNTEASTSNPDSPLPP